jgi:hypothetical protein
MNLDLSKIEQDHLIEAITILFPQNFALPDILFGFFCSLGW